MDSTARGVCTGGPGKRFETSEQRTQPRVPPAVYTKGGDIREQPLGVHCALCKKSAVFHHR